MQETENNSNKDLEKIDQDINSHRIYIFLIIIAVLFFYIICKGIKVPGQIELWGTVGDFFGGILNPIFALFAFYWLTYSVRLQIKELKETREELKKAATAQEESAKHQKSIAELENENVKTQKELLALQEDTLLSQQKANNAQQKQIEIQNFESLFFELIKTKNDAINMIRMNEKNMVENISLDGINVFILRLKALKKSSDPYLYYKNFMSDTFSSYLRITNQILKLLIEYQKKFKNIWTYINIFQATLSKVELEIIFFSGLFYHDLKKNIERSMFFSILNSSFDISNAQQNLLTQNAFFYDRIAFGLHEDWRIYFEEYERCDFSNIDINTLVEDVNFLKDYFILFLFNENTELFLLEKEEIQLKISEELDSLETKISESAKTEGDLNFEKLFNIEHGKDLNNYEKLKKIRLSNELYFLMKYQCNLDTLNKIKESIN